MVNRNHNIPKPLVAIVMQVVRGLAFTNSPSDFVGYRDIVGGGGGGDKFRFFLFQPKDRDFFDAAINFDGIQQITLHPVGGRNLWGFAQFLGDFIGCLG